MIAPTYNFAIEQGATGGFTLKVYTDETQSTVRNLTGYSARLMVRKNYTHPLVALSLSTPASGIIIVPLDGEIQVRWEAVQSAAIAAGKYVADLEIFKTVGGVVEVEKMFRSDFGGVEVIPEVVK